MARIAGVNIPTGKRVLIALTYIHGIGRAKSTEILQKAGHTVTVRTTRGDDIQAACGQLAGQVNDRTRRSERYRLRGDGQQVIKFVHQQGA